jgi:hypothetical protein
MNRILTVCYFAACLLSASLLPAQQIRVVAMTGDTMPRGDGVFTGFGRVVLGDSGDVAFEGTGQLTGSSSPISMRGIYTGDGDSPLHAVAQLGDLTSSNLATTSLQFPAINASGQVAYNVVATSEVSYVVEGKDGEVNSVTSGDLRTDGSGSVLVNGVDRPHLANNGGLTFENRLSGVSPRLGVFQTQGSVTSTIARDGELSPNGELRWLYGAGGHEGDFAVNTLGQVAVVSRVREVASSMDRSGLFLVDGALIEEYAVVGLPAPDGNGIIASIADPVLNDQQSVAFRGILTGTANGSADRDGIFRVNGTEFVEFLRTGDPAPFGPGNIRTLDGTQLNDLGQVLTVATFSAGVSVTNTGLILADEIGVLSVARAGTLRPDGASYYTSVRRAFLNDLGQVAFEASVGTNPVSGNSAGIFLYDEGNTRTIAQTGTTFLGSTITQISLFSDDPLDLEYLSPSRRTFNNLGQIAYRFTLADGRSGIAVWSIPEVPTGLVACITVIAFAVLRPRVRISNP